MPVKHNARAGSQASCDRQVVRHAKGAEPDDVVAARAERALEGRAHARRVPLRSEVWDAPHPAQPHDPGQVAGTPEEMDRMEHGLQHVDLRQLPGELVAVLGAKGLLAQREQDDAIDLGERGERAKLRERADPPTADRWPDEIRGGEQDLDRSGSRAPRGPHRDGFPEAAGAGAIGAGTLGARRLQAR